jgi:hypothetical protein
MGSWEPLRLAESGFEVFYVVVRVLRGISY